jgi:hypothetical protein
MLIKEHKTSVIQEEKISIVHHGDYYIIIVYIELNIMLKYYFIYYMNIIHIILKIAES